MQNVEFRPQIYPEWNVFDVFVTTDMHRVMKFDSKADTHAMSRYVDRPEMVAAVYDTIVYEKGTNSLYFYSD